MPRTSHQTMRRVIVAPDSFKESLTAREAAAAMARGVRDADPNLIVDVIPISDGGEGLIEALVAAAIAGNDDPANPAAIGARRTTLVTGPLREQKINACWALLADAAMGSGKRTAIIEMAAAAGLALVPRAQRDPTRMTTFGVGQLIRAALDEGAARILIGIGGSATCDGGCGMAQALGASFHLTNGLTLDERATPIAGGDLELLESVDLSSLDERLRSPSIQVACDVRNPLFGPVGAAHVYAPQKGAAPPQVDSLDRGLRRLAATLGDRADPMAPGAGAAGGIGYGLRAFLNVELRPGIELVFDALRFAQRIRGADLIITGEGRLDSQTLSGKAIAGIAAAARESGTPVVAIAGAVERDASGNALAVGPLRLQAAYSIIDEFGVSVDKAMTDAGALVEELARRIVAAWPLGPEKPM